MSDSNEKQLEVGGDFLESLSSANLANWQAINEMVANSIDAWFDMNSKSHQLVIDIQIDQQKDLDKAQLILQDNAMGMDLKTLEKAVTAFLHSDKKQGDNAHRYLGMFGFGLLGAAFTIGTELTVITTQDNKTHFKAESNVEDFKKDAVNCFEGMSVNNLQGFEDFNNYDLITGCQQYVEIPDLLYLFFYI